MNGILARGPIAVVSTLVTAGAVAVGFALSPTSTEPMPAEPIPVQHEADPELPEIEAPDFRAAASSGKAIEARALVGLYTTAGRVAEIPTRALAAYQRSATVLGRATDDCHLEWTLVAAVAQVLTDHGAQGGAHRIGDDGMVSPAIVSTPLRYPDGAPIPDTDGGRLDGDPRAARAVGPVLRAPPGPTARSARSCCRRRCGGRSASTVTATASGTRRTSTTPRLPPPSCSVPTMST